MELKDFLYRKNKALYAILLARNADFGASSPDERQELAAEIQTSEKLLIDAVQKSQLLDTEESLACMGHSVASFNLH